MTTIFIQGGNVLDTETLTFMKASALVRDGIIEAIGANRTPPPGAHIVDARGKTVMPGMIDCHTHIVASQLNLGLNANLPNALATLRAVPILSGILMRGFTTVRDAGGADWSLCEATRTDVVDGPRIFPAGHALSQTGGHGDFRARNDIIEPCACSQKVGNIGRVVDGVDNVRAAVREEIQKGATQIKIMASGGVASPNDPIHFLGYSEDEIRAIVEEATNAGTYVMAHAYTPRAISRAVSLGVRTIEHGNLVDAATAELMHERGAFMVPTLVTYEALANEGAALGLPPESAAKTSFSPSASPVSQAFLPAESQVARRWPLASRTSKSRRATSAPSAKRPLGPVWTVSLRLLGSPAVFSSCCATTLPALVATAFSEPAAKVTFGKA